MPSFHFLHPQELDDDQSGFLNIGDDIPSAEMVAILQDRVGSSGKPLPQAWREMRHRLVAGSQSGSIVVDVEEASQAKPSSPRCLKKKREKKKKCAGSDMARKGLCARAGPRKAPKRSHVLPLYVFLVVRRQAKRKKQARDMERKLNPLKRVSNYHDFLWSRKLWGEAAAEMSKSAAVALLAYLALG
jgi:hypothetical protein